MCDRRTHQYSSVLWNPAVEICDAFRIQAGMVLLQRTDNSLHPWASHLAVPVFSHWFTLMEHKYSNILIQEPAGHNPVQCALA